MNLYYVDAVTEDDILLDVHVAAGDVERAIELWQEHQGLESWVKPTRVFLMNPPDVEGIVMLSRPPCEVVWPH